MSECTECEKAFVIPELNCVAPFSVLKLPEPSNTTLDTTDLAKYYDMRSQDVIRIWGFTTQVPSSGAGSGGSAATSTCSNVAYVNSSDDWASISWCYKEDEEAEVNLLSSKRWVISPFSWECESDSEPTNKFMVPAPVTYATNKPSYLPSPVFNPNQASGGGGTIEGLPPVLGQVVSVNYSKNEATVKLYGLDASGDLVLTDEQVIAIIL